MPAGLVTTLGGLAAGLVSGITGSLFTVPTRKDAKLGCVCVERWDWANTWLLFTVFNVVLNLIIAQAVFGLDMVYRAYANASRSAQLAVLLSSALWAMGTVLFGLGVELSGVALGVGLAMMSQITFGTILPLFSDPNALSVVTSVKGGLTLAGVAMSIVGFIILGRASWLRDHAKQQVGGKHDSIVFEKEEEESAGGKGAEEELKAGGDMQLQQGKSEYTPIATSIQVVESGVVIASPQAPTAASSDMMWLGMVVSLFAGVFSSLLQYAFVFGSGVVHYVVEEGGASPRTSSVIIWTVSIAVNNMVQAIGLAVTMSYRGQWRGYLQGGRELFLKNTLRCLLMSLLLNAHIELYGLSQACLGALGPVLSWPLVMATVVLFSQVWGILLREWVGASRQAILTNWMSLGVITAAIALISIAASL